MLSMNARMALALTAVSLSGLQPGCGCLGTLEGFPEYGLPRHNTTNSPVEFALVGGVPYRTISGESAEKIEMQLEEDLEVIGPSGDRVAEPIRIRLGDTGGKAYYLDFNEGTGWYTVRLRRRKGAEYLWCREAEPGFCVSDVLSGASEPGIYLFYLAGPAADGSGDGVVSIYYSEQVRHAGPPTDMFELFDSGGRAVSCKNWPAGTDEATWPRDPDLPYQTDVFHLQCDGARIWSVSAIRVVEAPWSVDLTTQASYPPEGEMWPFDLKQELPDDPLRWQWEPDRRSYSEHRYATRADELSPDPAQRSTFSGTAGGCGAQTAPRGGAAGALVLVLALLPLGRRGRRTAP